LHDLKEPQHTDALIRIANRRLIESRIAEALKRHQQAVIGMQALKALILGQDLARWAERSSSSQR
jgi:GGDEF domain-containing protein